MSVKWTRNDIVPVCITLVVVGFYYLAKVV